MVIAQKAAVCGHGHGTRLINLIKHYFDQHLREPEQRGCFVVTQADIGPSAINFWKKQRLVVNEVHAAEQPRAPFCGVGALRVSMRGSHW